MVCLRFLERFDSCVVEALQASHFEEHGPESRSDEIPDESIRRDARCVGRASFQSTVLDNDVIDKYVPSPKIHIFLLYAKVVLISFHSASFEFTMLNNDIVTETAVVVHIYIYICIHPSSPAVELSVHQP